MAKRKYYRKGPVLLRGEMIPKETSDARLLNPEQDTDWLHQDPWRVMRIQTEFVEGFGTLAELGPAISVFGSARTAPDPVRRGQAPSRHAPLSCLDFARER